VYPVGTCMLAAVGLVVVAKFVLDYQ
jgi:hypothetical protein